MEKLLRLDKFISKFAGISRNESRKFIKAGKVRVNGTVIKAVDHKVYQHDRVFLNDKKLETYDSVYIALYKPVGYVSSRSTNEGKSVFELIDAPYNKELSIAGRLDKDAEGLLLLSNDGLFIHRVISPKYNLEKEYIVELENEPDGDFIEKMNEPISCGDEILKAKKVTKLEGKKILIILTEGKFHEIKRMVKANGNTVTAIKRGRIGEFVLPEMFNPGDWKELNDFEIKKITGEFPR
ncbi:MAG: rRNA pseudouridine synthase [Kosmotoga sp.]|uniref:pseudouridine synthase n=1 Tax=Kosmotoga sp. TaxID=1955248 RepID=UPI0025C01A83|nr:pseudouridine synthase [Kosmotoga sp.]MCD6159077.1 rRNA pseudouridine synthase [Kosmotoga sp.]